MEFKLTKTKLMDIVRLFNKVEVISVTALFHNDWICPCVVKTDAANQTEVYAGNTNNINGVHLIQNELLELPDGFWLFNGLSPEFKEHIKRTGIKNIGLYVSDLHIDVILDDATYPVINRIGESHLYLKCYETYQARINQLLELGDEYLSTIPNVQKIISGGVVTLTDTENTRSVRISRNLFPLMGAVRYNDVSAIQYSYVFADTTSGPTVIIVTRYKKLNAIHIYNYVEYDGKEDINARKNDRGTE